MRCHGNSTDHCCHLGERGVCPFLEENTEDSRRWSCGLYRKLGSWDKVHQDSEYLTVVRPFWDAFSPSLNCGDWPPPGVRCETCGVMNDG